MSSIYEGMYQATLDKVTCKSHLIRLWRNESIRVFADRLINETDRCLVEEELIPELVKRFFNDV